MGGALTLDTPAFSRRGQGVVDPRVEKFFGNPEVLLGFMRRTRKPVFHKSNVFFRDIQYAIRDYFDTVEREPVSMPEAERMARDVVEDYTERGLLRKVGNQAYLLESPEWATPKDGTYAMLTIHGAPLPDEAEASLDQAIGGTAADASFTEEADELKGGDVSADGNRIAELTLPIAPPANAERGHIRSGAPEEPHADPQAATDNTPKPKVENKPKVAPPPWMKKN
ncbi:MAG TPA: hypothetical protein VFD13_08780 [Candidatus Kapabacteria bacterium]|nr:hypothetical protein [Candidatus Kapabacteria bacterium]